MPSSSPSKKNGSTLFTKPPKDGDKPPKVDLATLLLKPRTDDKPVKPKKPTTPTAPATPPAGDDATRVATQAGQRRGARTDNDGRADNGLNTGTNVGGRDSKIAALKKQQAELETESREVESDIKDLKDEIKGDEGKASVVGTVVNVASGPVGWLMGAAGVKNPAESLTEKLLGVEGDKKRLEDKKSELDKQKQQIASEIKQLEGERVLNFLADVAHVTKMPTAVVQVLEGSDTLNLSMSGDTGIGADASYNKETKTISVDSGTIETAGQALATLREQGIVDEDGRIVDAAGFDASKVGDTAIGTAALLGVHEPTHGAQDANGDQITTVAQQGQSILAQAQRQTRNMDPTDRASVIAAAKKDIELNRIDKLEYDSYVNQETIELQAGKEKKLFTTINPDGSLLPREQAIQNIYALQTDAPMAYGVTAGKSKADVLGTAGGDHDDHDHGGDSTTPGRYTPGGSTPGRYTPGDDTPGRYTPGEWLAGLQVPGRYTPGDDTPGRYTPGNETPGRYTPGNETPGRYTPGEDTPGRYTPGNETPGRYTPGNETPGRYTPGDILGGLFTPGRYTPGNETPGRYTPGEDTPGRYTPGRYTPGNETPGRYTPGEDTPGRYTPGRYTPGGITG